MASNSSSSTPKNSPRNHQRRSSAAARGIQSPSGSSPPPPLSLSGIIDQEQFVASSSDSFPPKDASSTSFAEDGSDSQLENSENGGGSKKPAWNKPSNGATTADVGVVMGAESWPALSESARASPKSSSTYSLKALSQTSSVTSLQEMAVGSLSSPKEITTGISTPNSTANHVVPSRQRSMKRGGGSSSHSSMPANDNSSQTLPTQGVVVEAPPHNPGKSGVSIGESSKDNTYRDARQRGGSFRRNNSGPLFHGDGPHHHSHGRRDQDRGKQDWGNSHHRSFGSREGNASQQRGGSRPFLRGTAPNSPFIPPPSSPVGLRPFVTPLVYPEMPSPVFYVSGPHPDSLRPMSMVPFFSMPDPYLHSKIVNQIDYYFSNENLVKDTFLRQNMDGEGCVSIKLIAGFKKVMQLTDNIQLILHAIQASTNVEVQGDKVRRRNDWTKWIMPPVQSTPTMLATHLNSVALDEKTAT
ncbi:hypothetical protein DH2020_013664 [Rehmannia glutinosa]|uniref:HTH La-type RNA-binding domain-containing protein n=1 Tax=Rehmannia glutinosa TaxID=99300 RepID=A0ABR0X3K4_REHGL